MVYFLTQLTHNIIAIDDQHVSFSLSDNGKDFSMVAIYASTSCLRRKKLWKALWNLQNQFDLPWNLIGVFNRILGAYEHQSECCSFTIVFVSG